MMYSGQPCRVCYKVGIVFAGRRLLLSGFEATKERRALVRQIAEHGGTALLGIPQSPVRPLHLRYNASCPHGLPGARPEHASAYVTLWRLQEEESADAVIAKKWDDKHMECLLSRVTGIPVLKPSFLDRSVLLPNPI